MPVILNNSGNGIKPGEVFSLMYNEYGKDKSTTLTVKINDLIIITNNKSGSWSADLTTQISSGATLIYSFTPRPSGVGTGVGIWKATSTSVTINNIGGQYGFGVYRNPIYSNIVYKDSATDKESGGAWQINTSLHETGVTNGDIFIGAYSLSGNTITPWQIGLTGISSRGDFITRAPGADEASMTILGVVNDDSYVTCIIPAGRGGYAIFSVN